MWHGRTIFSACLLWLLYLPNGSCNRCEESLDCQFGSGAQFQKVKNDLHGLVKFADPSQYCDDLPLCDYDKYTYLITLPSKYYSCDAQFDKDVTFFVDHCLKIGDVCCRGQCARNPYNKRLTCEHSNLEGDIVSSVLLSLSLISILINIAFEPTETEKKHGVLVPYKKKKKNGVRNSSRISNTAV